MITHVDCLGAPDCELDLALAAELQGALLPPQRALSCPHQHAAALNRMCGSVGGDFLDLIQLNEEQIAVVMGDVVGHGVMASLLMAIIMGHVRSNPADCAKPVEMVTSLNAMLLDLGDRSGAVVPCSIFYAVVDVPSGVGFFVNAGHPMPFLCDRRTSSSIQLGEGNILIGVEDFVPRESCHTFLPGERLVLYTDGVIDATNTEGQRFNRSRLHDVLNANAPADAPACARAVFEAVDAFRNGVRQTDDESILVIDRN